MTVARIRAALITALEDSNFSMSTVHDNVGGFTPEIGTPYAETFFMPNTPIPFTMGDEGEDEHTGLVQINLNFPIGEGMGNTLDKVDYVRTVFKAGVTFTYEDQVVHIETCGVSRAPQIQDGFYQTIISITWRALTARN